MDAAAPRALPAGNAAAASTHARLVTTSVPPCSFLPKLHFTAFFAAALLLLIFPAVARDKGAKSPQVELLEFAAHRSESLVSLEANVRNAGDKPIHNLTLVFTFAAPDKVTVTTQRATIEEEWLAPGDDASIHAQLEDPVRAVDVTVSATDSHNFELRIAKPGPYAID